MQELLIGGRFAEKARQGGLGGLRKLPGIVLNNSQPDTKEFLFPAAVSHQSFWVCGNELPNRSSWLSPTSRAVSLTDMIGYRVTHLFGSFFSLK